MAEDIQGKVGFKEFKAITLAFFVAWVIAVIVISALGAQSWVLAPLAGFNFLIHELGHSLGRFSGLNILEALAGTFIELVVVISFCIWLTNQRLAYAHLFSSAWLGYTFIHLGNYMADASAQQLPLYTLGSVKGAITQPIHDWQIIFSDFGLIDKAETIGRTVAVFGVIIAVPLLILGLRLLSVKTASKLTIKS